MTNQHTVAKALIINDQHQALVLRRSAWPAHPERSHTPDFPGGFVDPGEAERDAVVREIREETGIIAGPKDAIVGFARTVKYEPESITRLLYVMHLTYTPEVKLSFEHEAYEWCEVKDLLSTHKFGEFYAEAVAYLIEHELI